MSDKIEINSTYIEQLTSLIEEQNSKELTSRIEELHIADIAEIIENVSLEKYGRVLADVYVDNVSIGESLIEKRLAVSYDGGRKHCPDDWMEYFMKK